jgi:hypothetical protein
MRTRTDKDHIDGEWSIGRQRKAIAEMSEKIGLEIDMVYHDHFDCVKSRHIDNPHLLSALEYMTQHRGGKIIVESPRQISTTVMPHILLRKRFMSLKIDVISCDGNDLYKYMYPDNPGVEMAFSIVAANLEYEEELGRNMKSYYDKMFADYK